MTIDKFLTHLCLPGKETLWMGVEKIEPGHVPDCEGRSGRKSRTVLGSEVCGKKWMEERLTTLLSRSTT